jgi:phage tail protein X
MKKIIFTLFAMTLGAYMAIGQVIPGTIQSVNGGGGRETNVNGLSQLFAITGKYTLSADGAGSTSGSYTIDVLKPNAAATVYKAYLFGAPLWYSSNACTQLNSVAITWDGSSNAAWGCCNYYADVTAIVAPVINSAAPGITSLPVVDCGGMDGHGLLVVFTDAAAAPKTIVILFGGLSTTGDNFAITLGTPIDPVAPGALLDMGLGISFSYQPAGQYSQIDINGQRLTTSAGGYDDGIADNGGLITVGGIGDLNTNPVNPFATDGGGTFYDDELYSLLPLITNTTSNIGVSTLNPSNDDNVFLAYFTISGAAIIGEGILLTQETDVNPVGTNHTVTAHLQDVTGAPVVGEAVTFTVISGPNQGKTGNAVTDAQGHAIFTYLGDGGVGIDQIEACFINSAGQEQCSNILTKEWIPSESVPVSNWALFIGIALILGFAVLRFRR